jgi:hypothetical protein
LRTWRGTDERRRDLKKLRKKNCAKKRKKAQKKQEKLHKSGRKDKDNPANGVKRARF